MNKLQPGKDGEPLPSEEWVIRVCKSMSMNGKITESHFVPSSTEKEDHPKHRLSVYAESLTTPAQCFALTNADPNVAVLGPLKVEEVRAIRVYPGESKTPNLDVEWHPISEKGDGAVGHCGIHDLTNGTKLQRRNLRVQLADLAQREFDRRKHQGSATPKEEA